MKKFTLKDLEEYNGKDGNPSYVSVNGVVYDITDSKLWKNGKHMNKHYAGMDLTESITQAPHNAEVLEKMKQVGKLKETIKVESKPVPPLFSWILNFHPHPITIHFPQAFFSFAPLFLVLFYIFKVQHLERTCFYLMVCGFTMSIPAFLSGILHWVYKYGKSTKPIYKFKLIMSLILIPFSCVIIFVHGSRGNLPANPVDIPLLILYFLLLPIIVPIGHAGGIIVFGSGK